MKSLSTALLLALASAAPALAVSPILITQEGRLLEADDKPVTGEVALQIRLWDGDGSSAQAVWTETYTTTPNEGRYAIVLGDTSHEKKALSTADVSGDRWLSVSINSTELTPRLRVGTVPTAVHAAEAAHALAADTIGGKSLSDLDARYLAQPATGPLAITGDVAVGGKITGDGSGLTHVAAATFSGTVADAQLSTNVALVDGSRAFTTLQVTGTATAAKFSGDGSLLVKLDATKLQGAVPDGGLAGTYTGALSLSSAQNALAGTFTGTAKLTSATLPTGTAEPYTCDGNAKGGIYVNTTTGQMNYCNATWKPVGGGAATLAWSAATVDFASATTATLTNNGSSAATGLGMTATGGFTASHNCGTSLAAGASCTATFAFDPAVPTFARTGSAVAWSSAGAVTIALKGTYAPPTTCKALLALYPGIADGQYLLDTKVVPYGPVLAWCDMTTDNGGWTLVMATNDPLRWAGNNSIWYDVTFDPYPVTPWAYGKAQTWFTTSGTQLLVKTHNEAPGRWASFGLPAAATMAALLGSTVLTSIATGCQKTLSAVKQGSNAVSCWSQAWCANDVRYTSSDSAPDSSVFAPTGVTSGRPCGGNGAYAEGLGVLTDTNSAYGGSFEGYGRDGAGNVAVTSGYASLYLR